MKSTDYRILSIETSTEICSVALHDSMAILGYCEVHEGMMHSKKLAGLIQELLEGENLSTGELNAVAVSKGPGSYTGLRIGVSMAKGICFAHSIPLIGVDSLQSMALAAYTRDGTFHQYGAMMDARRMEVYFGLYDQELNPINQVTPLVVEEGILDQISSDGKLVLFGNGMEKCREMLSVNSGITFMENIDVSSREIGVLARSKYEKKEFEDLAYFEPFYLKSFVAKPSKKLL